MINLSPHEIVKKLDRFIVGQHNAKRAVAVALRNRWRRFQLDTDLKEEVVPKNILMVGPTGVGKTEIARRLAKIYNAPFIKVEATKFTEVGYVGRDVEQMIRDLTEVSLQIIKLAEKKKIMEQAKEQAKERILDILVGESSSVSTRDKFREGVDKGEFDEKQITIQVLDQSSFEISGIPNTQMFNLNDFLGKSFSKSKTRQTTVKEALKIFESEEGDKLIDHDKINNQAIELTQENGIVFIDEIDKICAKNNRSGDVSREGVQRDLLPLIEGTVVQTKYGPVKTNHILFIGSGAFHLSNPSDLLPELQGRLPIRVELNPLNRDDFVRILKEPEFNLIKQYQELLKVDLVDLTFEEDAIIQISELTEQLNQSVENIGARRLHTILEKLLEEISFEADGEIQKKIIITKEDVKTRICDLSTNPNLSKFIL